MRPLWAVCAYANILRRSFAGKGTGVGANGSYHAAALGFSDYERCAGKGDVFYIILPTGFQQIVVNLAATNDDTLDRLRRYRIEFTDDRLEAAIGQIFQGRHR